MATEILDPEQPTLPDFKFFKYETAIVDFKKVVDEWDVRVTSQAEVRRNMRTVQVDIEALQAEGKMKADETLIPIRTIDANIKSEQPQYISYVKQSRRLAVFKCLDSRNVDDTKKQLVERDFTDALSYSGWEKWVYRLIDGAALHGWACAEVVFDTTKPGHVAIVPHHHEDVIFPLKARDLESQPFILVRITTTLSKLGEIAPSIGFNPEVIAALKQTLGEKETRIELKLYKAFVKYEGTIWTEWFMLDEQDANQDWLKGPEKLFLGRV